MISCPQDGQRERPWPNIEQSLCTSTPRLIHASLFLAGWYWPKFRPILPNFSLEIVDRRFPSWLSDIQPTPSHCSPFAQAPSGSDHDWDPSKLQVCSRSEHWKGQRRLQNTEKDREVWSASMACHSFCAWPRKRQQGQISAEHSVWRSVGFGGPACGQALNLWWAWPPAAPCLGSVFVSILPVRIDIYLYALDYHITAEVAQRCSGCQWLARGPAEGLLWLAANLPSHLLTTPHWALNFQVGEPDLQILTKINLNVIYLKVQVSLRHWCCRA